ncbi:protein phosphatase 1 regulatory subunit 42-like [Tachypleus tridentatus]|uniref:protein phosphatase 1 regulatory subunit 42-like n=1 Tax=Tachypleus tridentatus TaxID=6853 RepID=UPI003FD267C1
MVVKVTKNLMEKCASRQMSRQGGEDQDSFLARITHLYLQEQNFEDLSSLKVLNVSRNQLTTLSNLKELTSLQKLLAKNNCVEKLEHVLQTVEHFNDLRHFGLTGNPVSRLPYYRTTLITNVKTLCILDGKEITEESKTFLQQMYVQRKKSRTSFWTGNFDVLEKEQHTQITPHHIPFTSFPVRKYLPKIPKVVHHL